MAPRPTTPPLPPAPETGREETPVVRGPDGQDGRGRVVLEDDDVADDGVDADAVDADATDVRDEDGV